MHSGLNQLVGLVVVGLMVAWAVRDLRKGQRRRGVAARLEYLDSETSAIRKRELLVKYADAIVAAPHHRYSKLAKQVDEDERKEDRSLWVVEIILLTLAILFVASLDFLWKIFIQPLFR